MDINATIADLKRSLPSIKSSVPNLKRKTSNEDEAPCAKCAGTNRFVLKINPDGSESFLCRNCHPKFGDVIEFHAWLEGLTSQEFIKQKLRRSTSRKAQVNKSDKKTSSELLKKWTRITSRSTDFSKVYGYLCDVRKISKATVDKAIASGNVASYDYLLSSFILNEHYGDGTKPHVVAFRFDRVDNGETVAIESVSTTGKPLFVDEKGKEVKKKFEKGSRAKEGYFQAGAQIKGIEVIGLVEAAINALSGADCDPNICWLSIGGFTMTSKLKQLKRVLKGRDDVKVVCFFDNDEAGGKATQQAAKILGHEVYTVTYPEGLKSGYDVNDFLKAGQRQTAVNMIENAVPVKVKKPEKPEAGPSQTQSGILLEEAQRTCEFFHTSDSEVFAVFKAKGHIERHNVKSKAFKLWLSHLFYIREEKAPNSATIKDALNVISGIGLFDSPEQELFLRVAEREDCIFIDLCNDGWQVVKISADGWEVLDDSPVHFKRTRGMKAMALPSRNGNINALRSFLNISSDTDFRLVVAFLLQSFNPNGPKPILALDGVHGCAKNTTARQIREIVDPSEVPLRTTPKTEQDLAINAENSWMIALDNISSMQNWLSDALCRIATGGGFGTRELYEGREEELFSFIRPILLNGIDSMVRRHDLADRTLFLNLPYIPEDSRRSEKDLIADFKKALPSILGGLFNAISEGLKNRDTVHLDRLPRMADFALWVQACEPALPWESGGFMEVYDENREKIVASALLSDAVGSAVQEFMESSLAPQWEGTSSELLDALEQVVDDRTKNNKYWPKDAPRLGQRLRRSAGFLRQIGIEIEFPDRQKTKRLIVIQKTPGGDSKVTVGDSKVTVKKPNDSEKVTVGDSNDSKKPTFLHGSNSKSSRHSNLLKKEIVMEKEENKEAIIKGMQNTATTVTTATDYEPTEYAEGEL